MYFKVYICVQHVIRVSSGFTCAEGIDLIDVLVLRIEIYDLFFKPGHFKDSRAR